MPELPEVESVRRGVAEWTTGATITGAEVLDPRILGTTSQRRIDPGAVGRLVDSVHGRTITSVQRRGKFMWLVLGPDGVVAGEAGALSGDAESSELSMLIHLGMSGQLRVHSAGDELHKHTRAIFHLRRDAGEPGVGPSEEYVLRFIDQRIFGHVGVHPLVSAHGRMVPATAAHIAADPLEAAFDLDAVVDALARKKSAVKAALLDQSLVSGIGNIYADEALFRARVHPLAIPARTRKSRLRSVVESASAVMSDALEVGGTSFDSLYVNVNGESGYFDRALLVYGREGQECVRCGTEIERLVIGSRSSHFCPSCQRKR